MAITINSRTINTLKPDSSVFKSFVYSGSSIDKNSIGEYKMMQIDLSCNNVLSSDIYYQPAFWGNGAGLTGFGYRPSTAWKYSNGFSSPVGEQPMTMIVPSGYVPQPSKNFQVTIEFTSGTDYTIRHYYFEGRDDHAYLNASYQNNHEKFLKSSRFDVGELHTFGNAVSGYGLPDGCFKSDYHYKEPNDYAPPMRADLEYIKSEYFYRAGWYGRNAENMVPYFNSPEFIMERVAGVVTGLSVTEDTKIRFRIATTGGAVTHVFLRLFRSDTFDNTVEFETNYDDSLAEVVTFGGSTTIANKLKGPSTGIALVTGKYECTITVDKDELVFGEKYRIMAIVYRKSGGTYEVNSFISEEEIVVDELPLYKGDGIDFTATLIDVDNEYTGNDLECVVEERMRSKVILDYAANKWKNDILARLALTVDNDIRRYLTEISVKIYEETISGPTTTQQVYFFPVAYKTGPTTYTTVTGLTLDFSTPDQATMTYDWRNRYESHLANLITYVNGVALASPTGNMNWAGKNITVEWIFKFYYDDYVTPFSDTLHLEQRIRPKGYETVNFDIVKNDLAEDEIEPDFYCADDDLCFEAVIVPDEDGEQFKLITTIEPNPGSILGIEENEVWVPNILPQLTNDKILSQEEKFGDTETNKANFCLDTSNLLVNLPYKISAIAKKIEIDGILMEDSENILTESGNNIIQE